LEHSVGNGVTLLLDLEFHIKDMEGSLLQIESNDINKKRKAADFILNSLLNYNNYSKTKKYFTNLTVLILVPNGK